MSEHGPSFSRYLVLFVAGGCGSLARYWVGGTVQRLAGGEFPVGTFVVNLTGCLLFGLVWALAEERLIITTETRFLVLAGFVGAYTTFSTFAFDSQALIHNSRWLWGIANVVGQCVLGIASVRIGIMLGRLF